MWPTDKNVDDIIIRVAWATIFWFTASIFVYNEKSIWFFSRFNLVTKKTERKNIPPNDIARLPGYFFSPYKHPLSYFFGASTFHRPLLVQSSYTFLQELFFSEDVFLNSSFSTANLTFTVTISVGHLVMNPANTKVFRLILS